jgi:hypothetical protein
VAKFNVNYSSNNRLTTNFGDITELRQFYTGVHEDRTSAGGRGIAIIGAVTRKRLVTD